MDRSEIDGTVRREVDKVLGGSNDLGGSDPLAIRGLDSLRSVELTVCLEDAFDVMFDDDEILRENFMSIDSIVALLHSKLGGPT